MWCLKHGKLKIKGTNNTNLNLNIKYMLNTICGVKIKLTMKNNTVTIIYIDLYQVCIINNLKYVLNIQNSKYTWI